MTGLAAARDALTAVERGMIRIETRMDAFYALLKGHMQETTEKFAALDERLTRLERRAS